MTAEREALQRIRLVVDREDISCIGRIVVVKTFLDQALANPATGDDALRKAIEQALAHRYGNWTTILENALASSPAEPREASGYCPFCMTADPVAPAEPDEPTEAMRELDMCAHGADKGSYCGYCGGYSKGRANDAAL